jgi:putative tryptophan/tyrosine transport system substrate-binding protein
MLPMKRRDFIVLGSGALAWSVSAHAQRAPSRIGFLGTGAADTGSIFVDSLKEGLREHGLQEGSDYLFDFGWAEGDYLRFPELARRMVQNEVRVILATTVSAVQAAQRATATIPIVMTSINDPVGNGLVSSLARPGGNTTGLASLAEDVSTKLVELFRETFPRATSLAILINPANPSNPAMFKRIAALVGSENLKPRALEVRSRDELENAFASLGNNRPDALLVLPDFFLIDLREKVAALALKHGTPTITNVPEYTDAGALMSYGVPRRLNYHRSAYYVKRILDGANPSEMPIEQPTRIELSINLVTAKKLGVSVPSALQVRADRVIE